MKRRRFNPRLAVAVSVAGCGNGCDCSSISVRLHDQAGEVFAVAQMPAETARSVVEAIETELRAHPGDRQKARH